MNVSTTPEKSVSPLEFDAAKEQHTVEMIDQFIKHPEQLQQFDREFSKNLTNSYVE